ncbi:hypothetical protein [Kitasatospora sp. NPDC057738]|uniref:hypothetical protein n=1 Tax=Kitasatospora sp. NPDC057738 TaxID=3346233 RepID=UPI0036A0246F
MGLDFSHTEAHWTYTGFMRFRRAIATHEGIDLDQMNGFRIYGSNQPQIPWTAVTTALRPLLDHSDCDGELSPEECRLVAPRLREVVSAVWPKDCYDRTHGLLLADGMEAAAAAGEQFEFC